jgi:diguanylate cyclase (GGDEF)-like protein/PAS domain S-box-containing protein
MGGEIRTNDAAGQAEASQVPGSAYVADPLQGMRATKRWTWIGVVTALFSSLPARHFFVGSSLVELGVALTVGIIIAAFAIEFAFAQMFKHRKRSAYPGIILAELGRGHDVEPAAQQGLGVIRRLLGVRAAFLALRHDDGPALASVSGMDPKAADFILHAWMPEARETMASQEPVRLDPAGTREATGLSRHDHLVFVPVVALQQSVGVLAVASGRANKDLKDEQLLGALGVALGLSLENLRQKEDLRESEERYRDLFENAHDIVYAYTLDPPGTITSLNRAGERVTGYKLEELSHLNLTRLVPPEYHEQIVESLKRQFAGEDTTTVELEIIAKDGHRVPLEISPRLIVEDGKAVAVHAIARDITERKRAEEALRATEERLHSVVASTPIVLFALGLDGVFTLSEGKGLEALGLKPGEVVGQSVFDVYRDVPQIVENIRRALAGEALDAVVEVAGLVFESWYSPLRDQEGEITGVIGVATDITERKRAEEALRESETKFRTLTETVAAAVYIFQGTRIRYVNAGVEALTGFTRDELLTMNYWDVVHPDYREMIKERGLARQRGEDVPQRYETKLLTKNGEERWADFTVGLIEIDGEKAVLGTGFDITDRKRVEEALRFTQFSVDRAGDAVFWMTSQGRITSVNDAACRSLGYSREELLSMTLPDIDPDYPAEAWPGAWERLKQRRSVTFEARHRAKDGTIFPVEIAANYLEIDGEEYDCAFARDITERKRAEEALRESETKFRTLTETISAAAFIYQGKQMRYVNSAAEAITGYTRQELLSMNFWDVMHSDSRTLVKERGLARQKGERVPPHYEVKIVRKDGEERWLDFMAATIEFDGKPAVLGTAFDITERKRAEETIKHLAYHDALTGLPNRTLFEDRLTVALAQARRRNQMAAVMFLDLDRFKVVNDTVGHALGDQLLQSVAERLTSLVREGDTVARVGGDEFTLLLPEVAQASDAVDVAERIMETLRQPWVVNGHEFHVTTSIGIALYPSDGEDAQALMRDADTAMYRAKDRGRDNYKLYTSAMNTRIAERVALESSLRHGLERGEFVVHYQPQVSIDSKQVVGTEALVRWQHPERGLVLPAEFIPVAEDTGLIVPLGEWVLRTACEQSKAWQNAGLPSMRVAVNLSARQFQSRDLPQTIARVLEETGLDAHFLQLEITEGVAMQDVDFTITVLRELKEMGAGISIDDFGTGYSSLSYLKLLPVDAVKIDRSFVRDLTVDPNDAAIASSIIAMAHNLKLKVIAEGVETEEQLEFLKERRCDEMQGFLFSKAVPAGTIAKMLTTKRRRAKARVAADSA